VATRKNPGRQMSEEQTAEMLRRERVVLEERIRGKSFYQISREHGISHAERVFARAIQRDENSEFRRQEAIRLEEMRIDDLQNGIWDRALSGEPRAVEVALKVLERRARLHGLDFQDLVNGRMVEVEQAKVRLMASALVAALDAVGVTGEQRQTATTAFLSALREAEQPALTG
jgi:hypothetical protein